MIDLPESPTIIKRSLFAALDGDGNERDRRIAMLALSYLEPEQRRCFYLNPAEHARGLVMLRNTVGNNFAFRHLWWASNEAFFDVLWTMGVILKRPSKPRTRPGIGLPRNIRAPDGRGALEATFPCLRCGHEQTAPVGSLGPFTCRECMAPYLLRVNDGTRVAFAPPAIVKSSHSAFTPKLLKDALELFEASPTTPVEEIHTRYRALIKLYHPSVVAATGDPIAMQAAEEVTKTLNSAWKLLEQWHGEDVDIQSSVGKEKK